MLFIEFLSYIYVAKFAEFTLLAYDYHMLP